MAVPTVVHLVPNKGPSISDTAVEILGLSFRPAIIPPEPELSDRRFHQTAEVLFDGVAATDVRVFSTGLITAIPPKHAPGKVPVTVRNLDQDTQDPIPGEEHTLADGYEYLLPINTKEAEGDLARTVRTLLQQLKLQFLGKDSNGNERGDVTFAVQTDFVEDEDQAMQFHVTKFARLPGISIIGPELKENRFYSLNEEPTYDDGTIGSEGEAAGFIGTRVPYTVDLLFDVVCVTDNNVELLNLIPNFVTFMHRNKKLSVARLPDGSTGTNDYELDFQPDGAPKTTTVPGNSNLRSFSAKILIRGFDIEGLTGLANGDTNGVPNDQIVERNKTVDQVKASM